MSDMSKASQSQNQPINTSDANKKRAFIKMTLLVILATTILRTMGDAIESIAFPWEMLGVTARLTTVAGVSVALMLPWLFLPPILGKFIDNIHDKSLATSLATITQSSCIVMTIFFFFLVRNGKTSPILGIFVIYILIAVVSSMDIFHDYFTFIMIPTITKDKNDAQTPRIQHLVEIMFGSHEHHHLSNNWVWFYHAWNAHPRY